MKTIVVVTEDSQMARALSELIRTVLPEVYDAPVQVFPASSPDDILHILLGHRIDLLMFDHLFLGMSSLDLIRWLGPNVNDTAKIVLTKDSHIAAEPWKHIGSEINEVLARPLTREPLKSALRRCLAV